MRIHQRRQHGAGRRARRRVSAHAQGRAVVARRQVGAHVRHVFQPAVQRRLVSVAARISARDMGVAADSRAR